MIVTCPQCSARYKLDPSKISARGAKITCPRCRHVFVVYPELDDEGSATGITTLSRARRRAEAQGAPSAPPPNVGTRRKSAENLDFRTVGIPSWKVRVKIGLVYDFSDIKTLRKYIQDGRVTPEDVISHDAQTWVTIGDIPDLDAYFVEVYERAEQAIAEGGAGFEDDQPTNVVGMGSLGSDLAAQALAEATREAEVDPSAATNEHGPQFVDPFAALKDKQREKIQQRRKRGGGTGPMPQADSSGQRKLLAAAVVLLALGAGGYWFVTQDDDPTPTANSSRVEATKDGKTAKQQAAAEKAREEFEAQMEEFEEEERDPLGGDDALIPIVPDHVRKGTSVAGVNRDLGRDPAPSGGVDVVDDINSTQDCQDFSRSGQWGQAKLACKLALGDSPGNPAVMVNYGVALYEMNELSSARNQLSGAANSGSNDPRIQKYLGHIAREQGDVLGASTHYQAYLAANPNAPDKAKIEALLSQLQGT